MLRSGSGPVLSRLATGLLELAIGAAFAACTVQTYARTFSFPIGAPAATPSATATAPPHAAAAPPRLPFKGRLMDGNPRALPPAVAAALSDSGSVVFNYREELSHDHYTVPLALSAFDPLTYVGYPLGSYSVTAFASLGISRGDRVLGDYTAKVTVSRDYTLYYQPTYIELEHEAKAKVREKIDEQLYRDAGRLAQAAAPGSP
jgi:hypothetical protein